MRTLIKRDDRFLSDPFEMLRAIAEVPAWGEWLPGVSEGTLPVDIVDHGTSLEVRASLPGFTKEQIRAEVEDDMLSIEATVDEEHEEQEGKFLRRERRLQSLSRRIALPIPVDSGKADAKFADGVLTLTLPKAAGTAPKAIRIG